MKKILSVILILNIILSCLPISALGAFSIDYPLAEGLTYVETTDTLDDGKPSHTYTFKYTPGLSSFPVVAWGESQKSRKTLLKIAELYREAAVAGMNADFFSFYTGIPMGCMISEGRFLSSQVDKSALAVFEDGSLYIGTPDIKSTFTYKDNTYSFYYNKYPQIYSLYIMDDTYSKTTASDFPCVEIVLKPESDNLTVNSTTKCTVTEIYRGEGNSPIPQGSFVLTVAEYHASFPVFENMEIGEELVIEVTGSSPWSEAFFVIGGGDIIAENSRYIPETADEYSDRVRYARTAVGLCEDGSALFFSVNGKKADYSSGLTYEELANTLISMGAVTVLNLDGGGSTTVGVKFLGEDKMQVMNYPTDGYPRGISNAILFLNTAKPDGIPSNAVLFPNFYFALNNTVIDIDEVFFDSSMALIEDEIPTEKTYTALTEGVEFNDGKLYITNSELYERNVMGSYVFDGEKEISDSKTIYVPALVDRIDLKAEKRVLNIGESTYVEAYAEYNGFEAVSSIDSYKWQFAENNAEILGEGVLAENDVARLYADGRLEVLTDTLFQKATLIAEYGDTKGEIEIYVGMPDILLDGFDYFSEVEGYKSSGALVIGEEEFLYEEAIKTELIPTSISLMHKGKYKGKGNIVIITSQGEELTLPYAVDTDYSEVSGWTKLSVTLPEGLSDAIFIKTPFTSKIADSVTVDGLTASYGYNVPKFDDIEESWAKDYINAVYEMGLISGYTEEGKTVFAPSRNITRAEFAKLVTVFKNLSGGAETDLNFGDIDEIPEWSIEYIKAVSNNNIMNGRREEDGTLTFAPNAPITRIEAMLVLSRMMPDAGLIFPLRFTDKNSIPDWGYNGVEKVVSAGIITGYDDNTIRPENYITRAETAVVFTRLYTYLYEKYVNSDTETDTTDNSGLFNPLA